MTSNQKVIIFVSSNNEVLKINKMESLVGKWFRSAGGSEYNIIKKVSDGMYEAKVFSKNGRAVGIKMFYESEIGNFTAI